MRPLADRFWEKVNRRGPTECWPWTAATNEHGYGVMNPGRHSGPTIKAHRVSAELAGMDIAGRAVLHSCDNPPCVNPAHLRPGTLADNGADMAARDRSMHGSRNPNSRLTEPEVAVIKRLVLEGIEHRVIAARFDVSRATVSYIAEGKTWRRVPPAARDLVATVVAAITGEDAS
jgi:hypothetical protein